MYANLTTNQDYPKWLSKLLSIFLTRRQNLIKFNKIKRKFSSKVQLERKRRQQRDEFCARICGQIVANQKYEFLGFPNGPPRLSICHERAVHKRKSARLFWTQTHILFLIAMYYLLWPALVANRKARWSIAKSTHSFVPTHSKASKWFSKTKNFPEIVQKNYILI